MIVVVPVDGDNEKASVSKTLGRAPYFYLKDMETSRVEFKKNQGFKSSGGAGIQAVQTILDLGGDILLTPKIGENAQEVLDQSDIRVYKTESDDIEENIRAYKEGRLENFI